MTNQIDSISSISFTQELNRLITLCTHISQMATKLRCVHLTDLSYSPENVDTLLSMAENIEGSIILLESLLAVLQRDVPSMETNQSKRFHYTRDELFHLRQFVTSDLSDRIGHLLKQIVEDQSNDVVEFEGQSWRNIRTILM
ncbi:unnamed protein product [Adineta ricciae]|uniref:Uncharacterized protein n=1 Tax=Adineta ricciae TaxID=249248 RepID=A0A815BPM7_ADIRI|nr:unnamed protein product [Adineta ricciae]